MAHLTKAERIARENRRNREDWKGKRSPQPYKRPQNEVEDYIDELNENWGGDDEAKTDT